MVGYGRAISQRKELAVRKMLGTSPIPSLLPCRKLLALAVAALALSGCAQTTSIAIRVTDPTSGTAISGAAIGADVPNRDHPFSVATLLGQTKPKHERARTDAGGRAVLEGLVGRPLRLTVFAQGFPPTGFEIPSVAANMPVCVLEPIGQSDPLLSAPAKPRVEVQAPP